jgi:hypothetical protein
MVSHRDKKKLADRTCIYCGKEFTYPYLFLRHKKTKCWTTSRVNKESTSGQSLLDVESTSGQSLVDIESTLSQSRVNIESKIKLE